MYGIGVGDGGVKVGRKGKKGGGLGPRLSRSSHNFLDV